MINRSVIEITFLLILASLHLFFRAGKRCGQKWNESDTLRLLYLLLIHVFCAFECWPWCNVMQNFHSIHTLNGLPIPGSHRFFTVVLGLLSKFMYLRSAFQVLTSKNLWPIFHLSHEKEKNFTIRPLIPPGLMLWSWAT